MGLLTTHVLDTAQGIPAAAMTIELFAVEGEMRHPVKKVVTNGDGRCDGPLLENEEFKTGVWELVFHVSDYFNAAGMDLPDPPFLDVVTVRFGAAGAEEHYHVPLLVSPWSYHTYRGS